MKISRFEDLRCWQEARKIVNRVYSVSRVGQFNQDHRLVNQVRGAATSIMANIAEGFSRRGNREFMQFLFISKSSAAELQSHLYVSLDQGYIDKTEFEKLYEEADKVQRQLSTLIKYLASTLKRKSQETRETRLARQADSAYSTDRTQRVPQNRRAP